ncbi:MAG TPA: hypothetical protein VMB50_11590 [Myxococcales bacterium]|nr:hypothetical protein [Myxococcales bacterium]
MKWLTLAAVPTLVLVPGLSRADDVRVFTDPQGVQTYTNVPASQADALPPPKNDHGVEVYYNVPPPPPRKDQTSAQHEPDAPAPEEEAALSTQGPPPPDVGADIQPPPATANGQWVDTDQYGWLWMPYGSQYVSEGSADEEDPYAYVYDPSEGWTWLAAPWIWGWGPYPYFGALGPGRFGWYRGLIRSGYGWGGYRGGGPGRAGVSRGLAGGHRGGGQTFRGGNAFHGAHYGRGYGYGAGHGAAFRSARPGSGFHGPSGVPRRYSGSGGFSGGHAGGGFRGGGFRGGGRR